MWDLCFQTLVSDDIFVCCLYHISNIRLHFMAKNNSAKILRIAITGPESTGKTELAMKLAIHFNTVFFPEYARTYVETLNQPYYCLDVIHIAHKQIELERKY